MEEQVQEERNIHKAAHILWVSLNGDIELFTILINSQWILNSLSALGNPWSSISSANTAMIYNMIGFRIPVYNPRTGGSQSYSLPFYFQKRKGMSSQW